MPKKEERIKSHEYKKWEKFDADAELKKIEESNGGGGEEEAEEEVSDEAVLLQEATAEKERGNDFFKAGKFEKAVECYTRGIKCDPKSAVIVANRNESRAFLKGNSLPVVELVAHKPEMSKIESLCISFSSGTFGHFSGQ